MEEQQAAPQRVIKTSQIKADLQTGMTRDEIKAKYELTGQELKTLFLTPSLKGARTLKARRTSFVLEDDLASTGTVQTENQEGVSENQEAPARRTRGSRAAIPTDQANFTEQEEALSDINVAKESAREDAENEGLDTNSDLQDETVETEEVEAEDDRAPFDRA